MYLVRKLYLGRNEQLDELARAAGELYSETVATFWRIVRKKGVWLSSASMERICNSKKMHAHSADGIVQSFFSSLDSFRVRRKTDPKARPPHRQQEFFMVPYKYTAIRVKNGMLILSNGRGNKPLCIPWKWMNVPVLATLIFQNDQYMLILTYKTGEKAQPIGDLVAGVDLGEVHTAAIYDGERSYLVNGRMVRAVKQYRNKLYAKIQTLRSTKTKGSKQDKKLRKSLRKQLRKIDNQKRDMLHKQTTEVISTLYKNGVQTLVIGDIRNIRMSGKKFHKKSSQKIHQMSSGEVRHYLTYKAQLLGMEVNLINEAYTSQECPTCEKRTKPRTRNFRCQYCKLTHHRDIVGAYNIRKKYLGKDHVVGVMVSPISMRYTPHMRCSL